MSDGLWSPRGQTARWLVLGAMAINLVASLLLAGPLRAATAAGGDASTRIAYIAAHSAAVTAGWTLWIPASLGLFVVFSVVLRSLPGDEALHTLALRILMLGAVPDICNNLVGAVILPQIATRWQEADPALRDALLVDFELWDRFSVLLTGLVGNSFYAVAGFVLVYATSRAPDFPRPLVWLGLPLWSFTFGIAAASLADSVPALVLSVAATMSCFCLWCTGVAVLYLGEPAEVPPVE